MGKLIVLEGTDGSGKSTQFARLAQRLQQEGVPFQRVNFPRYSEPSSALIRMYLGGEFGKNPGDVNAYAASAFYAVDRYASYKQDWGGFYEQGGLILCDRYTTSNAVHQAAKVPGWERDDFLSWLYDFEYDKLGLPKPDVVLYFDLPTEQCVRNLRAREADNHSTADIHEVDEGYLASCRQMALYAAPRLGWQVIHCMNGAQLRPVEEIHNEVWTRLQDAWKE